MTNLEWYKAVEIVKPYIVRISTPRGSGTGFLVSRAKSNSICAVATAAHVVDFAHYWEEPIRLDHIASNKSIIIRQNQRAVFIDSNRDTASILFNHADLEFPIEPLISGAELSFFTGRISSWVQSQEAYLVDGVAINGVSGGPAFNIDGQNIILMGVVSAYVPNRATGEVLPGLCVIRNVTQFHEQAPMFASLDQAKSEETPATPPPPSLDSENSGQTKTKHAT
jgi:hypothetical protein